MVETLQKQFAGDKDAEALVARCKEKIKSLKQAAAEVAQRQHTLAEKAAKEKKAKQMKIGILTGIIAAVAIAAILIVTKLFAPGNQNKPDDEVSQYNENSADQSALSPSENTQVFCMKPSLGIEVGNEAIKGIEVLDVSADGSSWESGLRSGDVIISVDGKKVEGFNVLTDAISSCAMGDTIDIQILFGTETIKLKKTKQMGINLGDAPKAVVVSKVVSGGAADEAGIKTGDAIIKIGENKVSSISSYNKALDEHHVGETIRVSVLRDGSLTEANLTLESSELGILDEMPRSIEIEKGSNSPIVSLKVVGVENAEAIQWYGDMEEVSAGVQRRYTYKAGETAHEKGLRIDTIYDAETKEYTTTIYAEGITEEASGNYYCEVKNAQELTLQSSTVEIQVK